MNELKSAVFSGTSSMPASVPPACFSNSRERPQDVLAERVTTR